MSKSLSNSMKITSYTIRSHILVYLFSKYNRRIWFSLLLFLCWSLSCFNIISPLGIISLKTVPRIIFMSDSRRFL